MRNPLESPRPIGDFAYQTLVGTVAPDPEATASPRRHFGLDLDGTYLYGSFRDSDGRLYSVLRQVPHHGAGARRIVMDDASGAMRFDLPRMAPAPGFCKRRFAAGKAVLEGDRAMGADFAIHQAEDSVGWEEGDLLALNGRRVGPGLHWYTPYAGGGAYYHSIPHLAEGTLADTPVRGFLFLDSFYHPPGRTWGNDPLVQGVELHWHTFGNAYDDGTCELGHLARGRLGWGFALVNDENGNRLCTHPTGSRLDADDEGWAKSIVTRVGDEDWIWQAAPSGHMVDFGPIPNQNGEGMLQVAGDDRSPDRWMAWGETCVERIQGGE